MTGYFFCSSSNPLLSCCPRFCAFPSETRRAGNGVAAQCGSTGLRIGISNLRRGDEGADGRAIAQGLGNAHDVRHHIEVLDSKHPAGAGKAGLHLIDDEKCIVFLKNFLHALEVALGRRHDAGISLDGLRNECRRMTGGCRLDEVLHHIGTGKAAFRMLLAQRTTVAIGIGGKLMPPTGFGSVLHI